jgi:hypothetical protein
MATAGRTAQPSLGLMTGRSFGGHTYPGPSIHPVVLAVAACIPSNLGVRFTLVLHDRLLCPDEPRSPATRPTLPR